MRMLYLLAMILTRPLAAAVSPHLGLPLVDLPIHTTNTASMIPIWSTTDVTMTAGATLTVRFPPDWQLPAVALNVTTCQCVFMKFSLTQTAGTPPARVFTNQEVTVTAGTQSGQNLALTLPYDMAPGAFYVRIDDSANYKNPTSKGLATLALSYGLGGATVTAASRPIIIGDGLDIPGEIDGYVYSNASGVTYAVQGALILADSTTGSDPIINALPAYDLGPATSTAVPMAVSSTCYMAVTGADGRFKLQVPFNVSTAYHVAALYGTTGTAGTANSGVNKRSAISTVTVNSSYATPASVTLTGFSTTTNN